MRNLTVGFLIILLGAGFPAAAQQTQPIRIGVITQFTGDWASVGEAVKNGILLAVDELKPEVRSRITFVFEDDSGASPKTVSAYNKLLTTQRTAAFITSSSSTSKAIAPVADKNRTPLVAIATDPAVALTRTHVVNFWTTAEEEVRCLLAEIKKRGYKKVARIATIHDFPISVKRHFDAKNAGTVQIALDEEYPPDMKDFRTYLAKVQQERGADAIFTLLMPGHLGTFAKQARERGITLPLFGVEMYEDSAEVKASEGALVGQWYVNADDPNDGFFRAYKQRFPGASVFAAAHAHDIALLLAAAVEKDATAEGINNFLHNVQNFQGALGTFSASGDNRFTLAAAAKIVTADGFEKLPQE